MATKVRIFGIMLAITVLSFACNSKSGENHLSREKMQELLPNVIELEAYMNNLNMPADSKHREYIKNYDALLSKYGTNRKELRQSLDYWLSDPELMDDIFIATLDSLSAVEARVR